MTINVSPIRDTFTMSDSSSASAKEQLEVAFLTLVDIMIVVGPQIGYVFQFIEIQRTRSSSGYSPLVSLILLCSNTIRIYYYHGFHYRLALLFQALLTVLVHLTLLHKLITIQTEERCSVHSLFHQVDREAVVIGDVDLALEPGCPPRSISKETSPVTTPTATPSLRLQNDDPDLHQPQSGPCFALLQLANKVEARFQSTDYFNFWMTYCLCTVLGLVAVWLLFSFTENDPRSVAFVGYLALCTEALLLVPQVLRNANQGSTHGLSPILILSWVGGDALKLIYFITMKQPMPFLVCTIFQLSIDFVLLGQMVYFNRRRRLDGDAVRPTAGNNLPTPHNLL
ncbi:unnamed protein product [Phytomonas sp. EM1]|nr:unnamed protein product [Phytomonas sp. EM1]|eukprot:CCW60004.1 unnamed protein product [Phytomonas sp. isolate EM1]